MLQTKITEVDLKSQLINELEKLNREQLFIVHQTVAQLLADDLIDNVTEDWRTGKVDRKAIRNAINEHRAKQPYRKAGQEA